MDSGIAVTVNDLWYRYSGRNQYALKGINLEIKRGEIVLVAGPTGCGKSTFCMCLNGLIPRIVEGEMRGSVVVNGKDTRGYEVYELAQEVGMILQNPDSQLCALTVEDEVAFGPENLALSPYEVKRRVDFVLDAVGIQNLHSKYVFNLSCGQKQRVIMAASLSMFPDILVFDEPTSELDPTGTREVLATIRRLNESKGITIVLVEHKLEHVLESVNRTILMNEGEIVLDGSPKDVFRKMDLVEKLGLRIPETVKLSYKLWRRGFKKAELAFTLRDIYTVLAKGSNICKVRNATLNQERFNHAFLEPVVKVEDLWFSYDDGTLALKGINLDVFPAEFITVVGGNGAGKSTLAMNIVGLFEPMKGKIIVDGFDTKLVSTSDLAGRVGYTFQNPDCQLFCDTVWDEVAFGPRQTGLPEGDVEARVMEALEVMDLTRHMNRHPQMLSRGQRLRVAVASVLSMRPRVLILDEPMMGQDYQQFKSLMEHLKGLTEQGVAVIVITHDLNAIIEYSTRVVIMDEGKVVADGPAREVLARDDLFEGEGPLTRPTIPQLSKMLGMPPALSVDELCQMLGEIVVP